MIGERVYISEKIITSPSDGIFQPNINKSITDTQGSIIEENDVIGTIEGPNTTIEIVSPFSGRLTEYTVAAGERVRKHEPIARINSDISQVEDEPTTPLAE